MRSRYNLQTETNHFRRYGGGGVAGTVLGSCTMDDESVGIMTMFIDISLLLTAAWTLYVIADVIHGYFTL
jgi:hypothetical protein